MTEIYLKTEVKKLVDEARTSCCPTKELWYTYLENNIYKLAEKAKRRGRLDLFLELDQKDNIENFIKGDK